MKRKAKYKGGHAYFKRMGLNRSVTLHMDDSLYERLVKRAKEDGRSIEKQAIRMIKENL